MGRPVHHRDCWFLHLQTALDHDRRLKYLTKDLLPVSLFPAHYSVNRLLIILIFRHFMARAICLIAVPIMFYMLMFQIHFSILRNSGDGDAFMSSEFQHTLDGKSMQDTYAGQYPYVYTVIP